MAQVDREVAQLLPRLLDAAGETALAPLAPDQAGQQERQRDEQAAPASTSTIGSHGIEEPSSSAAAAGSASGLWPRSGSASAERVALGETDGSSMAGSSPRV